jgi:glycerol-3-phosphate dehydrogenase (NAD(P)+)
MNCTIVGKGAWGEAFGLILQRRGHAVHWLERQGTDWPAAGGGDLIFLALPCQVLRARLKALPAPAAVPVVSLSKGIEIATHARVSQIVKDVWPHCVPGVVSGPSFAAEVVAGKPTTVVAAAEQEEAARFIQEAVHQQLFRVYRSTDLTGVELGGALKNIYALAGGMCQGMEMGQNAMAGLLTRCLAEMVRIGLALGAGQKETLYGLSGLGDLVLTSYGGLSRNYQVGYRLGQGEDLRHILDHLQGTAEGVSTVKAVHAWVTENNLKAPVAVQLYRVLFENVPLQEAFAHLTLRQAEGE